MTIVFDIGGTNLRVAVANRTDTGVEIADFSRVPTPSGPEEALMTLEGFAKRLAGAAKIDAVAGSVAGVISPQGAILASPNLPAWSGFPLASRLSEALGASVQVVNDAAAAALGEAAQGAGTGAGIVAYLTIGTGVGGARVAAGRIDPYAQGFEPGHQIVNVATGETLESLVGGAALTKKYGKPPSEIGRTVFDELAPVLAAGVWNAIVHWSPQIVILGGSLMNEETAFRLADVAAALETCRRVLPALPDIRCAALGDEAGLYGAAALLSIE